MYWNPHHQHISAVFDLFFYVTCFFGFYFLNITRCMLWCCKTASQCCICPHGSIKNLYKAQLSELEALCGILQARDWWKVQHTQKVLRVESMTYIQTPVNKGSFIKVTVTPPPPPPNLHRNAISQLMQALLVCKALTDTAHNIFPKPLN